jgi:hypothetical protein
MRPTSARDEGGALPVELFRSVLGRLIGAPSTTVTSDTHARAYAPALPAAKAMNLRRR